LMTVMLQRIGDPVLCPPSHTTRSIAHTFMRMALWIYMDKTIWIFSYFIQFSRELPG
jgi:hypothetical protein